MDRERREKRVERDGSENGRERETVRAGKSERSVGEYTVIDRIKKAARPAREHGGGGFADAAGRRKVPASGEGTLAAALAPPT